MNEPSRKEQLYQLIEANPFISQQDLAAELGLSRSAVAGHIASLIRERRLLGRAYVLPAPAVLRPVVCIGAANVDRKLRSVAPLQAGTSNPATASETYGGVARNIAENLARLHTPVALLTAVGDDGAGRALQEHAQAAGIDMRGSLALAGTASGTYTAILDAEGELHVALADMALYDQLTPAFVASRAPQRAAAALTVADLNLPVDTVAALVASARADRAPLVIVAVSQPKMARLPDDLRGVRLLILNRAELETLAGRPLPTEADVRTACSAVQQRGAADVVVTCGSQGVFHTGAGQLVWLAAHQVPVVDVTGAGDAFAAAVCWSLVHERVSAQNQGQQPRQQQHHSDSADLTLACRRGLALAAVTVQSASTVAPALDAGLLARITAADAAHDQAAPLYPLT
ncbi:pseudouridine-5-phosphate glycosidase [Duganella sp. Leaf126]|uniref:carbohydrate kinase n=1 Tax=Duganella sp. Leaf126 TaxID=1736266 RepID=UPI0006F88E27|nr:carbohydrate kinase [Duganella sp. Leaf126]KQQ47740.1 pseudouridine-5-phosphate glycosidase [Duganella sp. Leaf126]